MAAEIARPEPEPSAGGTGLALAEARRVLRLEAEGLGSLAEALDDDLGGAFERAVEMIEAAGRRGGRVVVSGMGKSGHVGRKIAATLASTGTLAYFVHPAEASHGDLGMIGPDDVVLALSWSGEAPELADLIAFTRRFRVGLVAFTSQAGSALGSSADVALVLPRIAEACPNGLAPTTSTTMQIAMGDALAVALLSRRGFTARDFRQYHPGGKLGSQLRKVSELMHGAEELPLVGSDVTLSAAIVEMTSKRFGITGVVDAAGALIGVVSDGDLRRAFTEGFVEREVSAVMNRRPRTIGPDLLAVEALARLNEASITSLFVVTDRKPIGIVHIHDLLRAGVL